MPLNSANSYDSSEGTCTWIHAL